VESKTINLWSAMIRLADEHRKDPERNVGLEEDAAEVVGACSKHGGFGTELSLTVCENGEWVVRIFSHEDSDTVVDLAVSRIGSVRVRRRVRLGDVTDDRTITF
jgi:hypothetical protein